MSHTRASLVRLAKSVGLADPTTASRLFPSGLNEAETAGSGPTAILSGSRPVRASRTATQLSDSSLATGDHEPTAVSAERDAGDLAGALVVGNATGFPVFHLVDPDMIKLATRSAHGSDVHSIGAECGRPDGIDVARDRTNFLSRFGLP